MTDKGIGFRQGVGRALGVRCIGIATATQLRGERLGLSIHQFEVHRGIVGTGSLMDIDVQSVVALHLQGGLHTSFREHRHTGVTPVHGLLHPSSNLRKLGLLCLLLLSVIVARQPPRRMITRHGKLGHLLLNQEVVQVFLLRELIAEADAIVVHAEADNDGAGCILLKGHSQFVVAVTDGFGFAPYRFPCLIERRGLLTLDGEMLHQISLCISP